MAAAENLIITLEGPRLMGCRRGSSPSCEQEAKKKQNKGITPFRTSRGVALPLGQNTGSQKAE